MSLVLQLQSDIMNGNKPVADLLRFAMGIAAKLDLPVIENWIIHELEGYPDNAELPSYRNLLGSYEVRNPMHGWMPVTNGYCQFVVAAAKISEIEANGKETFNYFAPQKQESFSAGNEQLDSLANSFPRRVAISGIHFRGIVDAVTTRLLQWALELEKKGILGEGMTFNTTEKQAAMNVKIEKFTGVFGNVTNSTLNFADSSQVYQQLQQWNLPPAADAEIKELLAALKDTPPEQRPHLLGRVTKWLEQYGGGIGAGVELVKKVFGLE